MKPKLGFHMLIVQDVDRALQFYRDVLGLDVQAVDSDNDTPEWARLALDNSKIILHQNRYDTRHDVMAGTAIHLVREGGFDGLYWSGLHIEAYDIPDLCRRVEKEGGLILSWPRRARDGAAVADVVDTEGNVFVLYSEY